MLFPVKIRGSFPVTNKCPVPLGGYRIDPHFTKRLLDGCTGIKVPYDDLPRLRLKFWEVRKAIGRYLYYLGEVKPYLAAIRKATDDQYARKKAMIQRKKMYERTHIDVKETRLNDQILLTPPGGHPTPPRAQRDWT